MFSTAQALKLYEYDLRALESEGAREHLLEERPFIVREPKQNGHLRVSLKELLGLTVFDVEALRRRFQ